MKRGCWSAKSPTAVGLPMTSGVAMAEGLYTTATAALCLEVYYRHAIRAQRVAAHEPPSAPENR